MTDEIDPKDFEDTARAVVEACAKASDGRARARLLAEAGLFGVIAPEEAGGLGLSLRHAVPVVAAAGSGLLAYPLIEAMVLARALAGVDAAEAGRILSGESLATIAWSGVAEDGLVGHAPLAEEADRILIFRADGGAVLAAASNVVRVEPSSDRWDVDLPSAPVRTDGPVTGIELGAEAVRALRADADLLRAAHILGSASHCLSLAIGHAQGREQFGRPLSSYQVLRHKMSRDALVTETIRNGIARALSAHREDADLVREAAWLNAARSGPAVAENAIQIFGGMGFTWEVPLHRHLRQMRAQGSYGAAADLLERFGQALIASSSNEWYREENHAN
ncbi:acyl-CoA dehydrogenase family protein [Aquibium sp. ELW1220]|uniref:acyl-CoA dehydrogenase family protein n=1 Tax=Aquibium sp. ELW1220 TaxID=2976766 RepID=UPI0025B06D63|nr:acyl-CoA dehydrogenase family protein [Aquibium sp. ELW1220]MDN2581194.1 acyl-CoA/acyl-ACP dehydrogenase [Aquibium sp. ELW1220]